MFKCLSVIYIYNLYKAVWNCKIYLSVLFIYRLVIFFFFFIGCHRATFFFLYILSFINQFRISNCACYFLLFQYLDNFCPYLILTQLKVIICVKNSVKLSVLKSFFHIMHYNLVMPKFTCCI